MATSTDPAIDGHAASHPDRPAQGKGEAALRSASIAIARVICICGIVYVHAWTGLDVNQLRAQGTSWQSVFYWLLIELVGRSSVPLLSIISGWLVAGSVTKRSYGDFVAGKATSLLLPMILWNLIALSLIAAAVHFAGLGAPQPVLGVPLLNEVLHLTAPGQVDVQNAFLRDMFVCMVAAPLLVRLPNAALLAALGLAAVWSIGGWQLYVLLRPQILLFFLIGMAVRRFDLEAAVNRLPVLPVAALFVAVGASKIWMSIWGQRFNTLYPEWLAVLDNGLRLLAAVLFWRIARGLARTGFAPVLQRAEPYIFLLFCAHVLFIWLLAPVIGPLFGRFGEPGYPVFLLLQPLLALAAAILTGNVLRRIWPAAAAILSGGRLERTPARARPLTLQTAASGD